MVSGSSDSSGRPPGVAIIGVLVAADDPAVGSGLARLLQLLPGVEVRGVVGGAQVLEHVDAIRPEVVLWAPVTAGEELLSVATSLSRLARVILLATSCDRPAVTDVIRAGACGYLQEDGLVRTDLDLAVRGAAKGATVIAAASSKALTSELRSGYLPLSPRHDVLTRQERALMQCLVRGSTNSAIAAELYLAPKTVRNYLSRIYTKLGVHDRAEAIATWLGIADDRSSGAVEARLPSGAAATRANDR